MMKEPKKTLVEVFNTATPEDLDQIREQIADHEKRLEGLRAIERALDVRINGKPQRAKPAAPKKRDDDTAPSRAESANGDYALTQKRQKVARYLQANGPKALPKLGEACGIAMRGPGCLTQVLASDWFHVSPEGIVSLTSKGEKENPVGGFARV